MANQYLKLRRSSVPGKIPDTGSLEFGEIALNTYDGLAFIKKSGSLGEEVITIGSTQGAFTGSFSGSFTGSLEGTSSWATNSQTSSNVLGGQNNYVALWSGSSNLTSSIIYQNGSLLGINNPTPNRALDLISLQSNSYVAVASFMAPNNAIVGNTTQFYVGAQQALGNSISWNFNYQGSNSVNNRMSFEFNGYATPVLSMFRNGNSVFGGSTNSEFKLDVQGTGRYTNNLIVTGSVTATQGFTGSLFGTASWAKNALTASSADSFFVRDNITGSNALFTGNLTAQTLVIQTISSSVIYSSGSNIFGDELTDVQQFTGSVNITGSLTVNGFSAVTSDQTGSMSVLSASYAPNIYNSNGVISSNRIVDVNNKSLTFANTNNVYYSSSAGTFISLQASSNSSFLSVNYYDTGSNLVGGWGYGNANVVSPVYRSKMYFAGVTVPFSIIMNSVETSRFLVNGNVRMQTGGTFTDNGYKLQVSSVSTSSGSLWVSGSSVITGSLTVTEGITGSLFGTASWALNALTASFLIGYNSYQIATGSVTASVDTNPNSVFLIKSGSVNFFNVSSSGDTTLSSDLFIVKNITTNQPVLTVSQSIVKIATQSFDPSGTTEAGSIWFTSTSMYIGLE